MRLPVGLFGCLRILESWERNLFISNLLIEQQPIKRIVGVVSLTQNRLHKVYEHFATVACERGPEAPSQRGAIRSMSIRL
ncbi:hypothetical protein Gasu2_50400 [Galdieria sulphuraria]|nr:hypothetical protein Gasu2_50400 [Galdieria sulphuraria]